MCQGCNRREFMGVAAMGGALLASQLMRNSVFAAEGDPDWPPMQPAKIYRLFVGRTGDAYLTHPDRRNREVQPVLYGAREEARRRAVPGRRPGPTGRRGRGRGKDQGCRRIVHRAPVRPRRRSAGDQQADRCRPAHGTLLATLQRPPLDVFPAMAQGREESRVDADERLGRDRSGCGTVTSTSQDETHADPGHWRTARICRRLRPRTGQGEAGGRSRDDTQ